MSRANAAMSINSRDVTQSADVEERNTMPAGYTPHPYPETFFRIYDFTLPWIKARIPEDARVLDVGCGRGLLARELLQGQSLRELIAFDVDTQAVLQARSNLAAFNHAIVHQFDAEDPELASRFGRFDVVLARNSFHHFQGKQAFLVTVRDQLLAPGGSLLLLDLDARANFAMHGLGAYCTLLRSLPTVGFRSVLEILFATHVLRAEAIRTHREADRRRLLRQQWYTYRNVIQQVGRCLPSARVMRLGSFLGLGGCYAVHFKLTSRVHPRRRVGP